MKKILNILLMATIFITVFSVVNADFNNNWWTNGNTFTGKASSNSVAGSIEGDMKGAINTIISGLGAFANLIAFSVFAFLGVKFIFAGAEGKADIKEKLITASLGVIIVYSANSVMDLFTGVNGILGGFTGTSGVTQATFISRVAGTVSTIAKVAAFAGIAFTGIRFITSTSMDKAKIKESLIPLSIGIILIFAMDSVITLITTIGSQFITTTQ